MKLVHTESVSQVALMRMTSPSCSLSLSCCHYRLSDSLDVCVVHASLVHTVLLHRLHGLVVCVTVAQAGLHALIMTL